MLKLLRSSVSAVAVIVALNWLGARTASAQDYCSRGFTPDLFYNYYVAPVTCGCAGAMGAQLYVSPRPVPPLVGHTYITYQPLLPQEFLYPHKRVYYTPNGPYAPVTKTHVWWY
ncbi:MAG TPA: hypothetical protein VGY55_19985 [Pirellulales bacterium]|jgi:hypothetical protein|nr:hypothetical protein [Pirellulales bacterium]